MSTSVPGTVGGDGTVAIPASIWRQAGIDGAAGIVVEARDQEIVIRPATFAPEQYTPQRKAEFLLNNAVDEADYQAARAEVARLGLNADVIPHLRPGNRPPGA
jgi:hypothetical protein